MKSRVDVLQGSILRNLLFLMAPLLISGLCQQLYNMTDALVLGHFVGSTGIAVIGGSCQSLISTYTEMCGNMLLGCMTVIAYFYGARDTRTEESVISSLMLSFVVGAIFTALYVVFAKSICTFLAVPDDILADSVNYLRLYSLGFIPYMLFQDCIIIFRSFGETKAPTKLLIASFICNITLDYVFVGWLSLKHYGVALAFILTQILATLVAFVNIHEAYMVSFEHLKWNWSIIKRILKIGIPASISSLCYTGTNMLVVSTMNMLGSEVVASYTIYSKVENIYWIVMAGLGVALTTIVSQNYGAKQMKRVKKSIRYGMLVCFGLTLILSLIYKAFCIQLTGLFTNESTTVEMAASMLSFMSLCLLTYPPLEVFTDVLKCLGCAKASAIMTIIGICGSRISWILLYAQSHLSFQAVLVSSPISWVISSALFLSYWMVHRKKLLS
jgi:putative MATE family efflux protein